MIKKTYIPKVFNYEKSGGLNFKPKNKKSVTKSGVSFDSNIERIFYFYQKYIAHANIERNKSKYLIYTNSVGIATRFYPDFIVNGNFYELKGIVSRDDQCKRQQHPSVIWIVQTEPTGAAILDSYKQKLTKLLPNWRSL